MSSSDLSGHPGRKNRITIMRAYAQFESDDDHLRLGAIFSLPATWWQRICFRAELRADIRDKPDFLRDIGISLYDAHAEASRFFWEPWLLKRR
jgi:uncharacterized protein YjiS (DUF1127 family)